MRFGTTTNGNDAVHLAEEYYFAQQESTSKRVAPASGNNMRSRDPEVAAVPGEVHSLNPRSSDIGAHRTFFRIHGELLYHFPLSQM